MLLSPLPGLAEQRLALVIGNDAYSEVEPLTKAKADALAVGAALTARGFAVTVVQNASRRDMNRQIAAFTGKLSRGDTALLFYAGHGVEIDGENYLLPTDIIAPRTGERDFVKSESIALSGLLDRIRATGVSTTIAIIDACRDNPFATTNGRSIGGTRGLGRITAPQGTFVIFSAGAGQTALDGLTDEDPAANSVFTRLLLPYLSKPGVELRSLVADLRVEVRALARSVNHIQFPAYYDELLGDFYFSASTELATPPTVDATRPSDIRADFDLARDIGTVAALELFVQKYQHQPDDFSVQMAQQMIAAHSPPAQPAAAPEQSANEDPAPTATAPANDRAALVRATQDRLNAAGCSAGAADGVIGPRTRRAFARFATKTGRAAKPTDLGTQAGLDLLQAFPDTRCSAETPAPATAAPQSADTGFSLVGTWYYTATCALVMKVTGTIRYTRAGPDFYQGRISDSLGQHGTSEVRLSGRTLSGTSYFPGVTDPFSARLSPDGQTYVGAGSNTCTFTARRG